jgi:hypothetical protein
LGVSALDDLNRARYRSEEEIRHRENHEWRKRYANAERTEAVEAATQQQDSRIAELRLAAEEDDELTSALFPEVQNPQLRRDQGDEHLRWLADFHSRMDSSFATAEHSVQSALTELAIAGEMMKLSLAASSHPAT